MAKEIKLNLPSADDLFSTQEERDDARLERVVELPLTKLNDFPDHPFKVRNDEEMREMLESVAQYGVLVPGLVRPREGGDYEVIAGHRRKMASEIATKDTMPCIIRNLTDDEATIIMVDSNLQREKILPSEKAFAYKLKLEAMKRQGKRLDLTSTPVGRKSQGKETAEVIGEMSGDSKNQVRRYIRLTELIPEILTMVDENKVAMRPAVEISYLPKEEQQMLHEAMESEDCTPSHVQALKMRKFAEEGRLNEDVIFSIMQEEKPNQVEQFKLPKEKINKFFKPGTPAEKMQDTIVKALELWRQHERKRNDAR